MPDENPIIDEVRAIRDALARAHDYDLARIVRALRESEKRSGVPVVNLPPRPVAVLVRKVG